MTHSPINSVSTPIARKVSSNSVVAHNQLRSNSLSVPETLSNMLIHS
jgi:hypothetical protein